ncbi:MAG: hypothetical protein RLZZ74_508 [Cyanobacteriota bacterium]|jgi:hypothetical protein
MTATSTDRSFPQLFSGLLALAIAIIMAAFISGKAIQDAKKANDVLTVTGSAKRTISSDYITWRLSVTGEQPTLQQTYQEVQEYTARINSYLQDKQIPEGEIILKSLESYPVKEILSNGSQSDKTISYRMTQRFEVSSKEVDRIDKLSRQATELINDGIPIESNTPEYIYTQLNKLRIEMIAEATKDAKARAEAIANNTDSQVGSIRSAKTGVFQITPKYSTDVSDQGVYDTSTLEKDITAVVSVDFGME